MNIIFLKSTSISSLFKSNKISKREHDWIKSFHLGTENFAELSLNFISRVLNSSGKVSERFINLNYLKSDVIILTTLPLFRVLSRLSLIWKIDSTSRMIWKFFMFVSSRTTIELWICFHLMPIEWKVNQINSEARLLL